MTNLKFFLEFFLILLIFIFPPLSAVFFESTEKTLNLAAFSPWTLTCFLLAVFLFLQERSAHKTEQVKNTKLRRALVFGQAMLTLGLLCTAAAIIELLGIFLKASSNTQIIFPKTPVQIAVCALTFIAAAFYEEVLYRGYLPFALKTVNRGSKQWQAIAEVVAVLLFALGHASNGVLAVLNALICGMVLRRCALKTGHIWAGFAAHLIYNVFSLYALGNAG